MYSNIVVPLDGSELAECVLPHVETIARGCGTKKITFIRVIEPLYLSMTIDPEQGYAINPKDLQKFEEDARKAAEHYLSNLILKTKYNGVTVQWDVISGKAAESIADYAEKAKADLITIATHGRSGVSRWVLGSVADKLVRTSSVPVLMIRSPGCEPIK